MIVLFCFVALGLVSPFISAIQESQHLILSHSLIPPFEVVDGFRQITGWTTADDAFISTNFVRLTTDRQSKSGGLWTNEPIGYLDFVGVLTFRISGQGQHLFGDGMALWFSNGMAKGSLHGYDPDFMGFGIIFDTFKNAENMATHKDVSVIFNDGSLSFDEVMNNKIGCDVDFRYHEKRDDFFPAKNSSRARVNINSRGKLHVEIDAYNTGDWIMCAKIDDYTEYLPHYSEDWFQYAFVGMTASTGDLADNHDVISFQMYSDSDKAMNAEKKPKQLELVRDEAGRIDFGVSLTNIHQTIEKTINRIEVLEHQMEHDKVGRVEALQNLLKRLDTELDDQQTVIDKDLEKVKQLIAEHAEGDLEPRLANAWADMQEITNTLASGHLDRLQNKHDGYMDAAENAVKEDTSWYLPFCFLLVCVVGGLIAFGMFYRKLMKTHQL